MISIDGFELLTHEKAVAWDAFVQSHPLGRSILTSASRDRWTARRWVFTPLVKINDGVIVAGAALAHRRIPYLPATVLRVLGILTERGVDVTQSAIEILRQVEEHARETRSGEVDVRCLIHNDISIDGISYSDGVRAALARGGYVPGGTDTRGTYLVQVDRSDDELVESFGYHCRRNVRKALRAGVEVRILTKPSDLRFFCETHARMRERKAIREFSGILSYPCILPMFERGYLRLFGASVQNRVRNLVMVDTLGVPRAEVAATTEDASERGLAPTGQILHFSIMQWLRDNGRTKYDLGGAPGPEPLEGHWNYGVWRFKHDFCGRFTTSIVDHHRPIGRFGGIISDTARRIGKLQVARIFMS
jgi:hypothetical protein